MNRPGPHALLAFERVSFEYPNAIAEQAALREVNLAIDEASYTTVIGRSGSGKSTLLALMALLDLPTRGSVHFEGRDVSTISERDRARLRSESIGVVFQQFHLMERLTAIENVALGLRYRTDIQDARSIAADALASVGLASKESARASELSGGQRQRVAIARAVVGKPRLLLADEPTGNLDSVTAGAVLDLLETAGPDQSRALVVVTHDREVAVRGNRTIEVADGTIVADSAHHTTVAPS